VQAVRRKKKLLQIYCFATAPICNPSLRNRRIFTIFAPAELHFISSDFQDTQSNYFKHLHMMHRFNPKCLSVFAD
jgi:hypothetical protein